MAELRTKYSKRVIFPKGEQTAFLNHVNARLKLNLKEIANLAGVHVRSMTDWKREKFSISLFSLKRLCRVAKIPRPKNIEIRNSFWHTSNASLIGGIAVYKKYGHIGGDPEYRKKKWYEWWEREGKYKSNTIISCKPIRKPRHSRDLAEFVGILLGDGGISKRQVTVTLNKFDDRYFVLYVKNLIQKLFAVNPSLNGRKEKNVVNIVVSRIKLVLFLVDMGLRIGSKIRNQVDIPDWIKKSDEYTKRCLRGLYDTDGCFYIDRHNYKDKTYHNMGMNFTNYSIPILSFFKERLERLGFHPTQGTKFSILLRRENEIIKYFQEIGSSNLKHLDKFTKYLRDKYGNG